MIIEVDNFRFRKKMRSSALANGTIPCGWRIKFTECTELIEDFDAVCVTDRTSGYRTFLVLLSPFQVQT